MEKTNQLHQLLAAEKEVKGKASLMLGEAMNTFTKKDSHFDGLIKSYSPFEEGGDQVPPEIKEIVTTVGQKLDYAKVAIVDWIDLLLSKDATNASGTVSAKLKIGKNEFALSAIALLSLETQLNGIRTMYKAIPTLDPTRKWTDTENPGVLSTSPEVKYRTTKKIETLMKAEATKEHKAQVELINVDSQVGQYNTVYTSGRVSSARKAEMLNRIDKLIQAVKVARSKANQAQVQNVKVGEAIFNHINQG